MSVRTWFRNGLIRTIGWFKSDPSEYEEPTYRVLAYHRIQAQKTVAFRHQLDRLQNNYNVVTPEEFRSGEGRTDELNLLLTFDDGYLEWETQVLPELDKRNIRAVFFLCPDLVGLGRDEADAYCRNHLGLEPSLPLTESGVQQIIEDGHTLGNHLVKHSDLREASEATAIDSILEESQSIFEDRFNHRPDWLAYPFGDYFESPEPLRNSVSDFFDCAVTLIPGTNRPDSDPYFLKRDAFSPTYSRALETAWLSGGYDPLFRLTHLGKTLPA